MPRVIRSMVTRHLASLIFSLFCVIGYSQTSSAYDFKLSEKLVTYFSVEAVTDAVYGGDLSSKGLGGRAYRKYYGELPLTPSQREVFDLVPQILHQYPLAVVTRGQLYFISDDNCSGISDTVYGVDISEACRSHDYCYRQLSQGKDKLEEKNRFLECNEIFANDIKNACLAKGKECSFVAKYYKSFLNTMSHLTYRCKQSQQATMISELLQAVKDNARTEMILRQSDVFDFNSLESDYNTYCSHILSRPATSRLPTEHYACTGRGLNIPCDIPMNRQF